MVERISTPDLFDHIWPKYDSKKALFREKIALISPFLDETVDLIAHLSKDYKLAVVSSSGRSEIEPPLVRAGIRDHFQTLVCGLEAGKLKPAPEPYLYAAKLLGSTKPLVIEDSEAGVASAQAAGFDVLKVPSAESVPGELRKLLDS